MHPYGKEAHRFAPLVRYNRLGCEAPLDHRLLRVERETYSLFVVQTETFAPIYPRGKASKVPGGLQTHAGDCGREGCSDSQNEKWRAR
jgi:hypothetical protein